MKSAVFLSFFIAGLVFCVGVVLIGVGSSFLSNSQNSNQNDPTCDADGCNDPNSAYSVEFDANYLRLKYTRTNDQRNVLHTHVGMTPGGDSQLPYPRAVNSCNGDYDVCHDIIYTLPNKNPVLSLKVEKVKASSDITCYETTWESSSDDVAPTECIQMTDFWYGAAEMYYQDWPLNSWNKHMSFYLSGDMFSDPQQYGSVLERYWLSSQGVAIWVPSTVPLHVSMEKQQICFKGSYEDPYKVRSQNHPSHWLQYTTCFGNNPQEVHGFMFQTFFQRPFELPDTRMIKSPIWSTWARYKVNINESVVLNYAQEILDHGFSNSQLEIDDGYEISYGDFTFDPAKFPNASGMIDKLHKLDFRVTTWVTPFINPTSKNYKPGDESRYFLINGNRNVSSLIPWWNGLGSSIDFSNDDACDWYASLLQNVRSTYGVDSYKFDAGEINYVTVTPQFETHMEMENLGTFTQKYAECAYKFGKQIEVRSAWNCQSLPIFVRMMDKDSNWGPNKGLKTLIPTALTFSLLGYPYILPDMIGGNAYEDGFHGTPLPEKELFIRWLELTAFLPSMQFSYVPWQYDDETVEIAKKFVAIHENEVYNELIKVSNDYINRETEIGPIRPIWWVTKDDSRALVVDDEFMIGDRYLIAPIIENATRSRDVYLPGPLSRAGDRKMIWVDKLNKKGSVLGGVTIYDYPVELDEISWWELTLK